MKLYDNEILINPSEVKNIASGKVAIIASGPSISNINFERLSDLSFFAVNGSTLALPRGSKDYSYYYAIDDHFVLEERPELVVNSIKNSKITFASPKIFKTLKKDYQKYIQGKKICIIFRYDKGLDNTSVPYCQFLKSFLSKDILQSPRGFLSAKYRKLGFSMDLERGYFSARTIPYVAAQISTYMGFTSIYFAGLDLSGQNRFYESGEDAIASTLDDSFDRFIAPSFKFTKQVSRKKEISFYNLTLNSRLDSDIVEKMEVEKLYDQ